MPKRVWCATLAVACASAAAAQSTTPGTPAASTTVIAHDNAELARALPSLVAGTTLRIAPGEYKGGRSVSGIANLTVEAADPANPPRFVGGTTAWHFSKCPGLTLRSLAASGQTGNGINIDDGGADGQPTARVTLEKLVVSDVGPRGNCDGIKCSGIDDLTIRDCTIAGWGGQGIDLVGCHRVLIDECRLGGKDGFTQSAGVQAKGGSSDVVIEDCRFLRAGARPINAGGSTGLAYFRPKAATYEARNITIRNNTIEGSECACAFVGLDGGSFTGNTVTNPTKWIFRILQETTEPGFVPCRDVVIEGNTITYRPEQVRTRVNIGPNTNADSFRIENNTWLTGEANPPEPHARRPPP